MLQTSAKSDSRPLKIHGIQVLMAGTLSDLLLTVAVFFRYSESQGVWGLTLTGGDPFCRKRGDELIATPCETFRVIERNCFDDS